MVVAVEGAHSCARAGQRVREQHPPSEKKGGMRRACEGPPSGASKDERDGRGKHERRDQDAGLAFDTHLEIPPHQGTRDSRTARVDQELELEPRDRQQSRHQPAVEGRGAIPRSLKC